MPRLEGGKKHWYTRVFEIRWPQAQPLGPQPQQGQVLPPVDDDQKASLVVDAIGTVSTRPVHLTVFRDAWRFRFRKDVPTDVIFDRIFGSGTGGIHVTLELDDTHGLHCYLDGDNQGRTDQEKRELETLLQQYVARFKAKIKTAKENHEEFVWKDCDDPDLRFEYLFSDVKTDGFGRVAQMVGTTCKAHVVYPPQADSALVWSGAAVHPLQMLQNAHQRLIRDACRGLGQDDARDRESDGLSRFFHFQAIPPKPLGPADPQHPTIEDRMQEVESSLSTVGRFLDVADVAVIEKALGKARDDLKSVRGAFFSVPRVQGEGVDALKQRQARRARRVAAIPALAEMDKKMGRVHKALATKPLTRELCETAHAQLAKAHSDLGDALDGVCSVQNFHSIEPFYLFRLMVKFDLRATAAIPAGLRTKVSAGATGFLHNSRQMAWLFAWLRDKLVELDKRLAAACPTKGAKTHDWPGGEPLYCFYLKGGRAAKYAQNRGPDGENDWDTNIIINPNLPAGEWYATFVKVHNEVLRFLGDAKREFTIEMHDAENAAKFLAALDEHQAALDKAAKEKSEQEEAERRAASSGIMATIGSVFGAIWSAMPSLSLWASSPVQDEVTRDQDNAIDRIADRQADQAPRLRQGIEIEEGEREGCKAELIDIGIPRRDTIEAFAQWMHVCPHVKRCPDGIPIPDHLYFVAEYALMIREAFADRSISVGKTPKRVMRLLEVLELEELDALVYPESMEHIPQNALALSAPKTERLDEARKRMVVFLVVHLFLAYELRIDAGLSKCFDKLFASALDAPKSKAVYPKSLTDAIKAYEADEAKKPREKQVPYAAKHAQLADTIGYVQWVAQRMDTHFRKERAPYLLENRADLERFVSAIYTGSVFALHEELEVKLAITGAFAARLHAEYGRLGGERLDELEPIRRLDITVYARNGAKPEVALELIEPLVKAYVDKGSGGGNLKFVALPVAGDTLCLTLPVEKAFSSEFTYKPLVVKITAVTCEENWPSVSFIRGLPVLNLRDLIWEYKRRAGEIEEAYTQEGLRVCVDALGDLLTRFENPSPGALPPMVKPAQAVQGGIVGQQPPQQQPPAQQPPQAPIERGNIQIERIGQRQSNWCWAATSLIMRKFYLHDPATLEDVVREAFGDLTNAQNALRLQRLQPRGGVERRTLSWADVKRRITEQKPFVIGNAGHYYACYGYEQQGERQTLLVWDPTGEGAATTIPYATYERGTREQDWATACDFAIVARRELVPFTLAATAVDFNVQGASVTMTLDQTLPVARVARWVARVRAELNVRGEVGAVLGEKKVEGRTSDDACSTAARDLLKARTAADGTRFLLEIEVELAEGGAAYVVPNQPKQLLVTVTHARA
jgi:hypothetical protein